MSYQNTPHYKSDWINELTQIRGAKYRRYVCAVQGGEIELFLPGRPTA